MTQVNFNLKFWLAVGLQIIIAITFFGYNQYSSTTGERILLKLSPPRDPLSLLQGHYLALNYEISQLNYDEYFGPSDFQNRETIYVILEKENNYYKAYRVSREKPEEAVFIKGEVISNYQGNINIKYGIENYFIPEDKAKEIEKQFREAIRAENIFIEVSIDKSGNAFIKRILIGEKEIDLQKIEGVEEKIGPQEKARDARAISAMSQIRTSVEVIYDEEGDYAKINCNDEKLRLLCDDIEQQVGSKPIIWHSPKGDKYCAYTILNSGEFYCIDSELTATTTSINPSAPGYCDGSTFICPGTKIEKPEQGRETTEIDIKEFHFPEVISNNLPISVEGYSCASCSGTYNYLCPKGYHRTECEYAEGGSHGCCTSCIVVRVKCEID